MLAKPRRQVEVLQTFREAFATFQHEVNKLQVPQRAPLEREAAPLACH